MATDEGREAARQQVRSYMSEHGWNPSQLAREAGIDPGTAGDFLAGTRWPKLGTLGKIERAVDLDSGALTAMANGGGSTAGQRSAKDGSRTSVGGGTQDAAHVLLDAGEAFDGLSDIEREEAVTAAKLALLAKAREIRNRG